MTQLILDIYQAEKKRDEGIERATLHAEAVEPGWNEKAYGLLQNFLISRNSSFMVEELRSYATLIDFPLPPNPKAWGGIIRKASKQGLVSRIGYSETKNIKSHRTPASVWIKS